MPSPSAEQKRVLLAYPQPLQLLVELRGDWRIQSPLPRHDLTHTLSALTAVERLTFSAEALQHWDSQLLVFLRSVLTAAKQQQKAVDLSGLPADVQRLLTMAQRTPLRVGLERSVSSRGFLQRLGTPVHAVGLDILATLHFIGEVAHSTWRALTGRGRFSLADLWLLVQECGPKALPIVTLVSFLVGTILAYMGSVQLQQFGAQIFIADLVGLGMAREMAAIMTGIVVSGRSGAAFAAQLGTMQVNEEIDALKTMGISPIDYLVLPRMLALTLMVPLLTLYANAMGILGGMVVAVTLMDLHVLQYLSQTIDALSVADFVSGIIKGCVYGILIALAGCMRGMQCGQSAQAVGAATTSAVVTSIVFMVIAAAVLAVVFHEIGL